ncbi:helix-turn-helix transcriptional regulator [Persicimonas caeni]|nr:helix-turn-helix transcriptional regulator [Persicimonas caeni]
MTEIPSYEFERARRRASAGLMSLVGGSHVLMVIQQRIAPESAPLSGFAPVFSQDFGPDLEARQRILQQWQAHEPETALATDPVFQRLAAGIGELRTVRHRGDIDTEEWAQSAVRRLLEQLSLEDRVNVVVPLGEDIEVSYCIDRPQGAPIFSEADSELLLAAIEGLRPLTARFVRRYGFMPGQHSLDLVEQRAVEHLIGPQSLDEIAPTLDLPPAKLAEVADQIYQKLGVGDRVGLMSMWMEGAEPLDPREAHLKQPRSSVPSSQDIPSPQEEGPLVTRVRDAIDQGMQIGEFEIDQVARHLGLSVRGLQRDLGEADTSYRDLVEAARQSRAEVLLTRPWLTFSDIAQKLGYTQVSSFNRAVKRWTGKTPSELRQEFLAEESRDRASD